MSYTGFEISERTFSLLCKDHGPKFQNVFGLHVTHEFGKFTQDPSEPFEATIVVDGYACDDFIECFVVTVNGERFRPDGKVYHLTWSLDRNEGKKPVHSNDLIKEKGWQMLPAPHVTFTATLQEFN